MGFAGLALLLATEFSLVLSLRGLPLADYFAQRGEVHAMPVETRDHAEACQPALGRLGLEEDREALREAELEPRERLHHARPARLRIGSKIHSIRRRRSRRMSASTCIPGRSGSGLPYAPIDCDSSSTLMR